MTTIKQPLKNMVNDFTNNLNKFLKQQEYNLINYSLDVTLNNNKTNTIHNQHFDNLLVGGGNSDYDSDSDDTLSTNIFMNTNKSNSDSKQDTGTRFKKSSNFLTTDSINNTETSQLDNIIKNVLKKRSNEKTPSNLPNVFYGGSMPTDNSATSDFNVQGSDMNSQFSATSVTNNKRGGAMPTDNSATSDFNVQGSDMNSQFSPTSVSNNKRGGAMPTDNSATSDFNVQGSDMNSQFSPTSVSNNKRGGAMPTDNSATSDFNVQGSDMNSQFSPTSVSNKRGGSDTSMKSNNKSIFSKIDLIKQQIRELDSMSSLNSEIFQKNNQQTGAGKNVKNFQQTTGFRSTSTSSLCE
jgi:hypothetical protein